MDSAVHPMPRHKPVVLTCPPLNTAGLADVIRQRGNIPLAIDGMALLELGRKEIRENWNATAKLPAQRAASLSWQLAQEIADDDEPETHCRAASVLFLLALHQCHASLDRALTGCRIEWNDNATTQKMEYLATNAAP
jgi:hypothetical protein